MHPNKFMRRGAQGMPRLSDAERAAQLEALGTWVANKRTEAMDARKQSGIESVWLACEEAYLGIDDMNRHEFQEARWAKPTSMSGPLTSNTRRGSDELRSTAFVRLTSRYVDWGAAKLGEIILPIDDKAFSFKPTPNPDLIAQQEDLSPLLNELGQPVMRPVTPNDVPQSGAAQQPGMVPATKADEAQQILEKAAQAAEKAEQRVYDWMVESKYPAEMRKVIKDAARIGVGVLKGPFPEVRESKALTVMDNAVALQINKSVKPAVRWVDPWNLFPADGCGENIHDGDYVLERDFLSKRKLKKLKDDETYLPHQIDKVLEEGPDKCHTENANPHDKKGKNRFTVWYFYGTISRQDIEIAIGDVSLLDDIPKDQPDVYALVTIINDTVVRAVLNPLEKSGNAPFHVMSWSRRPGHWAGVGVAEQLFMPQRACNAATRAILNNAGISSGVQIIIDQMGIVPADGQWIITPNKLWYKTAESTAQDVRQAFMSIQIPNVFNELMGIVQYAMRLAEEATGIPLLAQGQEAQAVPQTFGQAELQNTNAHTWLRSVGYSVDDQITEPLTNDFYEWLLLDPSVPNDEKGDFEINANGSVMMVERAIQEQTVFGLLNAAGNPAFGLDPERLIKLVLKAKRLDPRDCQYSDEEKAEKAKQPPAPPIPIAVAQINAEAKKLELQADQQKTQFLAQEHASEQKAKLAQERQLALLENQTAQARIKADTDRDTVYVQAEMRRDQTNALARMEELRLKREIAYLQFQINKGINVDDNKVKLADTAMKLRMQKELAFATLGADMHKHFNPPQVVAPAVEPPGRAPDGEAFQR